MECYKLGINDGLLVNDSWNLYLLVNTPIDKLGQFKTQLTSHFYFNRCDDMVRYSEC